LACHLTPAASDIPATPATAAGDDGPRASAKAAGLTASSTQVATAPGTDRSGAWLAVATIGLALLAAAAAAVSFTAQYRMVLAERHQDVAAGLEAAIPDAGALVFASLGIALALHGKHAVRARTLNVAAVGASVVMNVLAASPGWRGLAIWAMPPVAYALASDTMIAVIRARAVARQRDLASRLAEDEPTPLALAGAGLLWVLRLMLAPRSTVAGFRSWVLESPAAPGKRTPTRNGSATRPQPTAAARLPGAGGRPGTKTSRFLALVGQQYGPLGQIDLSRVSPISSELAPRVRLNTGAARTALRRAVLNARKGDPR
jgi:Protein of unknown function (DUF2637)